MNERFVWVKSTTGTVKVDATDVSGEPVRVLLTPRVSTAYRDKQIVLCDEPVESVPVVVGGKKK